MKHAKKKTRQRKHRDSRGSILIFVVGVLVLLALSAMAYLISARSDRVSTKQHEYNVQVELLLDGAIRSAAAAMTATTDLSIPLNFYSTDEVHSDSPAQELWMATRVPVPLNGGTFTAVADNAGTVPAVWRMISSGIYPGMFETPEGVTYSNRVNAIPTSIGAKPAFMFSVGGTRVTAADADGDGIADAGLIRVPVGPVNGITYYVGFRIVDQSSAVNVNTAFSRDVDYDGNRAALGYVGADAVPTGMFTASVGLREFLRTYVANTNYTAANDEWKSLLDYNFPGTTANPPFADVRTGSGDATSNYRSVGDRKFHLLGRRVSSPDPLANAFDISDQLSLAYRFTVRDANASNTALEARLGQSVVGTAATGKNFGARPQYSQLPPSPYPASGAGQWFYDLFDFAAENPGNPGTAPYWRPRRALLTVTNPETGLVAGADLNKGTLGRYQTVVAGINGASPVATEKMDYYSPTNTTPGAQRLPTRCSINTARFPELWRAFWNVMVNPANIDASDGNAVQMSRAPFPTAAPFANATFVGAGGGTWAPVDSVILRSAQAAVNAIDMRDADSTYLVDGAEIPGSISCRQITMKVGGNTNQVFNVFGTERQLFISRVVMGNNAGSDPAWVAVELHNPYDHDLVLPSPPSRATAVDGPGSNWRLARISRTPPLGVAPYQVDEIFELPAGLRIPARGFYVVYAGVDPPTTVTLPGDVKKLGVLNLGRNQQLMLLRPRNSNGELSANDTTTTVTNEPNEIDTSNATGANLAALVPLDACTLRAPADDAAGVVVAMERPTGDRWKCVYQDPDEIPKPVATIALGSANSTNTAPSIQILANDWPAPVPLSSNGTASKGFFPYGGFSRLGDILQVPYIGPWTILDDGGKRYVEMTTLGFDAYYARSTAGRPADTEGVGRFFSADPTTFVWDTAYVWAKDIFTFFTVAQHPWDDYTPNAPTFYDDPNLFANGNVSPRTRETKNGPLQGLVNINTAPQKVLATLPWMPMDADRVRWDAATNALVLGTNGINDNEDVATGIVFYRDYAGAPRVFKQVADLFDVPAIQVAGRALAPQPPAVPAPEPDDVQGDITPIIPTPARAANTAGVDGVRGDFEETSLVFSRVSNLVTVRSDAYTCYIVLQGYRYGGTANAELVVERRAAFMLDRSKMNPADKTFTTIRIPTN